MRFYAQSLRGLDRTSRPAALLRRRIDHSRLTSDLTLIAVGVTSTLPALDRRVAPLAD